MSDPSVDALRGFLADGRFATAGALMSDLDGTAVFERAGRIFLPPEVERGLLHVHQRGRLVIANTLRFPLSVIRVFGDEWHRATGADLPLISLKGSQIGHIVRSASGETSFEELSAVPMNADEIGELLVGIEGMIDNGVNELLVFHYPRDWRKGERIWTPDPSRVAEVQDKYASASQVFSGPVTALREALLGEPICMVFLLVEAAEDRLMAYQHTARTSFFTHRGVDKRSGAQAMANRLGIDLTASIGAGDAPPDEFLSAVGFAIIVGNNGVDYKGLSGTVRVDSVAGFGRLLDVIGEGVP